MEIISYINDIDNGLYLQKLGVIDNASSVIWTPKYFEPGNFEIHIPNTADNRDLIRMANDEKKDIVLYIDGSKDAGIIEYGKISEGSDEGEVIAKGRFLSSMLDRHVIKGTYMANNIPITDAVKGILAFTPFYTSGIIKDGNIETSDAKITFQATYKNILEHITKISKYSTYGYRVRPDFDNHCFYFDWYAGKNATDSQKIVPKVIFSEDRENVDNAEYEYDMSNLRTYSYIGGSGEGSTRIIAETGSDTLPITRREKFIDDSSESKEDTDTDDTYKNRLKQKGNETLESYITTESFNCDTDANKNYTYHTDYDVGDIVSIIKETWKLKKDMRITSVQETYENGGCVISPTFGNPMPETIDWEDR